MRHSSTYEFVLTGAANNISGLVEKLSEIGLEIDENRTHRILSISSKEFRSPTGPIIANKYTVVVDVLG